LLTLAAGTMKRLLIIATLALGASQVAAALESQGVADAPCPRDAIVVEPGTSIQEAVDRAGNGATFCLKSGIHRMQIVRPRSGQSFHGEGNTVLNGARLLTIFTREGRHWAASGPDQPGRRYGQCTRQAPACNMPEGMFIDDRPLLQVPTMEQVDAGRFYFDRVVGRIYFADDPTGRKVEVTVAAFAFGSKAPNVLIRNVTIEKYASVAQKGAVQAQDAVGWIVENCELRLNSGAGIAVGTRSRVRHCNIHHNGQIGIAGAGRDILIESNWIWANNSRGFSSGWEAGGAKLARGDGVVFRGNHVHDNVGPGLWCDIKCRDVVYENNLVERNHGAGIFHEISYRAVIRNNIVRHNGIADTEWFWGDDILVAASEDVEVYGNTLTVSPGKCGIILIDQGRPMKGAEKYKTRHNRVHDNEMIFEGAACAGGASDTEPGDENFAIITNGNNVFDGNVYRVPRGVGPQRFVWGHAVFEWDELRRRGIEPNGRLVRY
jgi:hypothetical protein